MGLPIAKASESGPGFKSRACDQSSLTSTGRQEKAEIIADEAKAGRRAGPKAAVRIGATMSDR
jgi:hypothetical protein